jgi:hypothetical protein
MQLAVGAGFDPERFRNGNHRLHGVGLTLFNRVPGSLLAACHLRQKPVVTPHNRGEQDKPASIKA